MDVTDDHVRRTFSAQTNMAWKEFVEKAYEHINRPHDDVRLGYWISGDARALSYLTCEYDWKTALNRLKERVVAVRTRAVTMEVMDMVSTDPLNNNKLTYWLAGARARTKGTRYRKAEGKAMA